MADTFFWHIIDLKREVDTGFVSNVVWQLNATRQPLGTNFVTSTPTGVSGEVLDSVTFQENNGPVLSASQAGSTDLPKPNPDIFVPYEDLTETLVVNWITDFLGEENVSGLENALKIDLDNQENPKTANGIPW